jgi:outer membrane protein assembly factor BamB
MDGLARAAARRAEEPAGARDPEGGEAGAATARGVRRRRAGASVGRDQEERVTHPDPPIASPPAPEDVGGGPRLRRDAFLAAAALGILAPGALAGRAAAGGGPGAGGDWPQAAHDLSATRSTRRAPRGLAVRWRRPLAGGVTGPAVAVDCLVVAASLGGEVAAFDLADGRERWRRAFPPAVYGSGDGQVALGFFGGCATAGGRVVVASDRVRCLRLRDGTSLWEAAPLRPPGGDDYFWGAPVIACGLAIVGSGAGSEATATRGRVSAYRLADGALRWSAPMVPEGANGGGVLSPVSVDPLRRAVLVGTGSPYLSGPPDAPGASSLVELALDTGAVRWSDRIHRGSAPGLDVNSAPVLAGGVVAVTAKDGVWAWDRRSRARLWHRQLTPATPAGGGPPGPVNGPEGGPIAAGGGGLLALSNDGDAGHSVAAALERRTGEVRWRSDLGGLTFAAPAVAGDRLCASTASGDLEVLRLADGSRVATVALGAPSAGAVSAAGGRLLVGVGAEPFLPGGELVCIG